VLCLVITPHMVVLRKLSPDAWPAELQGVEQDVPFVDRSVLVINETGKNQGLLPNPIATLLCQELGVGLSLTDYIAGTAILVDQRPNGEYKDLEWQLIMRVTEILMRKQVDRKYGVFVMRFEI
jgi:hypothetical protein